MYFIVGLGNPGNRYKFTRHNFGFMALEKLAHRWKLDLKQKSFDAVWVKGKLGGSDAVLAMPQTYMNLSGTAVRQLLTFFKADIKDLIVIHDDLDLSFGTIRLKAGGGNAGHKGLASITSNLGSTGFMRVRLGIGKPVDKYRTESYVLEPFNSEEIPHLPEITQLAADAVDGIISSGIEGAMVKYHKKNIGNSLKKEDE
ncbi:MAG TPA: aminoacyl-tRNA hydrolase [Smithellaceae bacterium]|nr:aminoacyl-tRNA hydrolase [Smithellaceae bacterium]